MNRRPAPLLALVLITISGCRQPQAGRGGDSRASSAVPQTSPAPSQDAAAQGRRPASLRVYVSNERGGDISVIDPATRQVVATIPVGKRPRGIHVTRDGSSVFVALSG